jgi:hypothetical protein
MHGKKSGSTSKTPIQAVDPAIADALAKAHLVYHTGKERSHVIN